MNMMTLTLIEDDEGIKLLQFLYSEKSMWYGMV